MISFVIPGNPIPTGRPRVTARGTFLPKASREYQRAVAAHAKRAMALRRDEFPLAGPVAVRVAFVRGNRRACDLDNLGKSILDGLTQAGAWGDDAQVVELHVTKRVDAAAPRAEVHVYPHPEAEYGSAWEDAHEPIPDPSPGKDLSAGGA